MTAKLRSLHDAAALYARDGILYASGAALPVGSDAIAFGQELIRQGRQDLHVAFHCATQQLNLLCAAGAVTKAECGFSGLEVYGFANGLRRAVESGTVALEDWSNLSFPLRLLAGALGWPFAPTTTNIGSDVARSSAFSPAVRPATGKIPTTVDPFTGRQVGVLPPLKPDLAAIHVTLADAEGNAIMLGTEWSRWELSRAAGRVVLLAEHIVDGACIRQFPNLVRIPAEVVDAVVWWPFAAWPQSSVGDYDSDEESMKQLNEALRTDAGYTAWRETWIDGVRSPSDHLARLGEQRVMRLSATPTRHLLDPFRPWILPADRVASLTEAP